MAALRADVLVLGRRCRDGNRMWSIAAQTIRRGEERRKGTGGSDLGSEAMWEPEALHGGRWKKVGCGRLRAKRWLGQEHAGVDVRSRARDIGRGC